MVFIFRVHILLLLLTLFVTPLAAPAAHAQEQAPAAERPAWGDDYAAAAQRAATAGRDLLVWFDAGPDDAAAQQFAQETLADASLDEALGRFERVRIPAATPAPGPAAPGVPPQPLLETTPFQYMYGRPGLAVIEFSDHAHPSYGQPISEFPFAEDDVLSAAQLAVVLELPPGTVTERTMIYAIRIHPEQPRSTQGEISPVLATAAADHSDLQASLCRQGHHHWERRFHEINDQFEEGMVAREVCAESWPNEELVTAAIGCVRAWRHSPGHWRGVRAEHPFYGYDIELGKNGTWYATGIFVAPYGE